MQGDTSLGADDIILEAMDEAENPRPPLVIPLPSGAYRCKKNGETHFGIQPTDDSKHCVLCDGPAAAYEGPWYGPLGTTDEDKELLEAWAVEAAEGASVNPMDYIPRRARRWSPVPPTGAGVRLGSRVARYPEPSLDPSTIGEEFGTDANGDHVFPSGSPWGMSSGSRPFDAGCFGPCHPSDAGIRRRRPKGIRARFFAWAVDLLLEEVEVLAEKLLDMKHAFGVEPLDLDPLPSPPWWPRPWDDRPSLHEEYDVHVDTNHEGSVPMHGPIIEGPGMGDGIFRKFWG